MKSEQEIALFQSALMEKLYNSEDARKMIDWLKNDPQLAAFYDYLESFDLTMVELGSELVKKWARKEPNSGS